MDGVSMYAFDGTPLFCNQKRSAACDTWSRLKAYHHLPCHHAPFPRYVAADLALITVDKLFQSILLFHPLAQKFCLLLLWSEFAVNRCELLFKSQGCVPTQSLAFSAFSAATIPSSTQSLHVISVWLCFFCYSCSISLLVLSAWVKSSWIYFDHHGPAD